jgi:hypothetical protein
MAGGISSRSSAVATGSDTSADEPTTAVGPNDKRTSSGDGRMTTVKSVDGSSPVVASTAAGAHGGGGGTTTVVFTTGASIAAALAVAGFAPTSGTDAPGIALGQRKPRGLCQ